MKERTYLGEVTRPIIIGTIIGSLIIAIIMGITESIFQIERLTNLEIFQLSFGFSFIIVNILYVISLQVLKNDKQDEEIRKLRREIETIKHIIKSR